MTTTMKSKKYPGWTIEKETARGRTTYLMTRNAGIYAISVIGDEKTGFTWELMTKQYHPSRGDHGASWEACHNTYEASPAACVAEAERRAATIAKQKTA